MAKKALETIDVPARFKRVSGQPDEARLGVNVTKKDMSSTRAERFLSNARLGVEIKADKLANRDVDGQVTFVEPDAECSGKAAKWASPSR